MSGPGRSAGEEVSGSTVSPMHEIVQQLKFFADLGVTHLDVETVTPPPTLEEVRQELGDCQRCKLHGGRTNLVFGVGDPAADLMFVGEAPGADEDAQGIPFVGRAGKLLTKIIEAIDLSREQVYIANILKCRPPSNRDPEPDEVETCEPFLFQQIEAIQPRIIVALGKYAAQNLLRTQTPISKMRGEFVRFQNCWLLPTFHPSYLLRNPSAKRQVWDDMKKVRDRLKELTR
jgi:uracil-DNA glycosylase family 4